MEQRDKKKPQQSKYILKMIREMVIIGYRAMKTLLWLYYFIALEWITGELKNREKNYSASIGIS